jgi:hypothetical protein
MTSPIGLGECSFCNEFTMSVVTCGECGRGFCFGCMGNGGLCYSCEQQQFREDHDLDWDWRDEDDE